MCTGEDMKYICFMQHERGGVARRDERAERRGRLRFAADAPRRKHGKERGPTSDSEKARDDAMRRGSAMDGAGEDGRGAGASEERRDATPSALENAKRGRIRRRQPGGTFEDEAICAGLRPEDILVYVERSQGRGNRPSSKASTVAANPAAIWNRRWLSFPHARTYEQARRPLSQVAAYALPSRLLRSRATNAAQQKSKWCAVKFPLVRKVCLKRCQ